MSTLKQKTIAALGIVGLCLATAACDSGSEEGTVSANNIDPNSVQVSLNWDHGAQPGSTEYDRITGYYIYYGRDSGALTDRIDVGNVTAKNLLASDFNFTSAGRYYFSVSAYNTQGMSSTPSTEVFVDIN